MTTYSIQARWTFPDGTKWYKGALAFVRRDDALDVAFRVATDPEPGSMVAVRVINDADGDVIAVFPVTAEPLPLAYDLAFNDAAPHSPFLP